MIGFSKTKTKAQAVAVATDDETMYLCTDGALVTGKQVIAEKNPAHGVTCNVVTHTITAEEISGTGCTATIANADIPQNSIACVLVSIPANVTTTALATLHIKVGTCVMANIRFTGTPAASQSIYAFVMRYDNQVKIISARIGLTIDLR